MTADVLNERTHTAIIYKQGNMERYFLSIAAEIYIFAYEKKTGSCAKVMVLSYNCLSNNSGKTGKTTQTYYF